MPLQKQTVAMPLLKGIDLSIADSLREGDSLSSGKNVEQLITGELTKREGFASVASTSSQPRKLAPLSDSVVIFETNQTSDILNIDSNSINSFSANNSDFNKPVLSLTTKMSDLIGYTGSIDTFDTYYNNGVLYVAHASYLSIIADSFYKFDENFNVIPVNGSRKQDIPFGCDSVRFAAGFLFVQSGNTITPYSISGALTAAASIVTNLYTGGLAVTYDICDWSNGGYCLVYDNGTDIVIRIYSSAHSILSSTTLSRTNMYNVCIFPVTAGTDFCVGVVRSAGNYASLIRYNSSCVVQGTANSTAASTFYINLSGIKPSGLSDIYFAHETGSNVATNTTRFYKIPASFSGTVNLFSYLTKEVPRCGLGSKWAAYDGTSAPVILLNYQSTDSLNIQNSYFLVQHDTSTVSLVARLGYGFGPNYKSLYSAFKTGSLTLPNIAYVRSGELIACMLSRSDSASAKSAANSIFNLRALNIKSDTYFQGTSVTTSQGAFVANNGLVFVDNGTFGTAGFLTYPDPIYSNTNLGAGSVADGTYSYVLVYEYYDTHGNLVQSAPSVPYTVTYAAGSARSYRLDFYVPPFYIKTTGNVVLYRTLASGTIYYRVEAAAITSTSITDNYSDATIASNQILYTTGGAVENIDPPNCNFIGVGKNRLWTFETGVSDILWFSKEFREGYVPTFSDLLTINMGKSYGPLVGVAQIDDKMLVFKEFGVYVIFGDGPSDNLVGQWSTPTAVVQGMGCIEARSILETTQGVIYQSQEGLYLIDKSLQNQFIGRPLYKNEGTIRAAVYDASKNCAYFLTTTKLWVFYFTNPAWYEWTIPNPIDLVMSNGVLYLATTTKLLKQTAGVYQDDSTSYEQTVKLGQFQFAGIQGYQRLYRLLVTGRKTSDADSTNITAKVYINGNTSETDTKTIAHTTAISGNRFEIEIRPSIQKCETMELELTQTAATSGMRLSAVTAEVGGLTGAGKRGSDRRL